MSNDYIAHYGVKGMKWKHKRSRHIAPGIPGRYEPTDQNDSSSSNEPKVSKEYLEELEFNSQKNVYPSKNNENTNKNSKSFFRLTKKKIKAKKQYLDDLKSKKENGEIDRLAYLRKKARALNDLEKMYDRFRAVGLKKNNRASDFVRNLQKKKNENSRASELVKKLKKNNSN